MAQPNPHWDPKHSADNPAVWTIMLMLSGRVEHVRDSIINGKPDDIIDYVHCPHIGGDTYAISFCDFCFAFLCGQCSECHPYTHTHPKQAAMFGLS